MIKNTSKKYKLLISNIFLYYLTFLKQFCCKCNFVALNLPYYSSLMKKKSLFLLVTVLFGLIACKKEKMEELDKQKPSITMVKPTNGQIVKGNENLQIEVKFSDNMNLSQYKLEIHPNFDGHSHGKTESEMVTAWEWDTIVNISGKEHTAKFSIQVPNDVKAGNYHFTAMCTDEAGYEAPLKYVEIKILNPEDTIAPSVNLTYPSVSLENEIVFDSTENEKSISLQGSITDNMRVKGFKIQLVEHQHGNTFHEGEDKVIYEYQNMNLNGTSFDLSNVNLKLYREDLENDGEYELKVIGYDAVGNSSEKVAILHVKLQ